MIALISGRGRLPEVIYDHLDTVERPPLVCYLEDQPPDFTVPDNGLPFRIERLGNLLFDLQKRGVEKVVFAGSIDRPNLSVRQFNLKTLPLLLKLFRARKLGDDGALRVLIDIFGQKGIEVVGAHEVLPELVMLPSVPTRRKPNENATKAAVLGREFLKEAGIADLGQAAIITADQIVAREDSRGTQALIKAVAPINDAVLYKGPKPNQDRRVDMPTIGLETIHDAASTGLDGVVIAAHEVIVLDKKKVIAALDDANMFLWATEVTS